MRKLWQYRPLCTPSQEGRTGGLEGEALTFKFRNNRSGPLEAAWRAPPLPSGGGRHGGAPGPSEVPSHLAASECGFGSWASVNSNWLVTQRRVQSGETQTAPSPRPHPWPPKTRTGMRTTAETATAAAGRAPVLLAPPFPPPEVTRVSSGVGEGPQSSRGV